MELRRAASGLVKVICRTADNRPGGKGQKLGKPKKKDGLLASFGDWFGSINMMNILSPDEYCCTGHSEKAGNQWLLPGLNCPSLPSSLGTDDFTCTAGRQCTAH